MTTSFCQQLLILKGNRSLHLCCGLAVFLTSATFPSIFLDQSLKSTETNTTSLVAKYKKQTTKYPTQAFGVLDKPGLLKELGATAQESDPFQGPSSLRELEAGNEQPMGC